MEQALVSIICPVFNRKVLVGECIDSIAAQKYCKWELIVVDDDSDDGTYEYIQERARNDNRIKLFKKNGPRGAPSSRNIGIKKSTGKYIIFLDSDDFLSPTCLSQRVATMEVNKVLDFAVFPVQIFHEEPGDSKLLVNIHTKEDYLDRFLTIGQKLDVPWVVCSVIWKSSSIRNMKIHWDESIIVFQDVQFNISGITSGMKFLMLQDVATDAYWRMHDGVRVGDCRAMPKAEESNERLLTNIWCEILKKGMANEARRKRIVKSIIRLCFDRLIIRGEYLKANELVSKLDEIMLLTGVEKRHLLLRVAIGKISRYSSTLSNILEGKVVARNKELYVPLGGGNCLKHETCE